MSHAVSAAASPAAEKLKRLRQQMASRGIDGFFIPRADEFQGEYVPASADRLAWISGFTGSAGCAIVLADQAAFFTDGRYTIQTLAEVDGDHFYRYSTADNQHPLETRNPLDWLGMALGSGKIFGIDPWVHTPADVERLRASVEGAGSTLKLLDDNPLDAAWGAERPPIPLAPVAIHPLEFSGVSSANKRAEVAAALKAEQCDVLAVTLPEDICWLLNVRGGDVPCTPFVLSYALAHADGSVDWFVDDRKLTPDIYAWVGDDVRIHALTDFAPHVEKLAADKKVFWIDPASAPVKIDSILRRDGGQPYAMRTPISLMKACKNDIEIAGTKRAHHRDAIAVCRFLAALAQQSGPAKHDELTAAQFLYDLRATGERFKGLSFDTISGAGGNGAIVHYRASEKTNKPLLAGPIYLVDSGAQYLDGTTDITRTLAVDTVDDEMRDRYTRVLKGHIQVTLSTFPEGTTGDKLDIKARAALREVGLDYAHGTGHGVGSYLSVHEGPCGISPRSTTVPLMPGMILSNEPGYYKEGAYGIRIENLVLVIDTGERDDAGRKILGFETLTLAPYERALIDTDLLTKEELDFINAYHERVRNELLEHLEQADPVAAQWLASATFPL